MTNSRRYAFTLVELLVVIGIIALLISMLLPALSDMRKQGLKAKCLSNLRQVGIALSIYAAEEKCWIPEDEVYVGTKPWYWYQFLDGSYPLISSRYVKARGAFTCPATDVSINFGIDPSARLLNTYGMLHPHNDEPKSYHCVSSAYFQGFRLAALRNSSTVALVADTSKDDVSNERQGAVGWRADRLYATGSSVTSKSGIWTLHPKNTANVLFADFHCEPMTGPQLTRTSNFNFLDGSGKRRGISRWKDERLAQKYAAPAG